MVVALAVVAAVAIAGLVAAPGGDAPWAAYAQTAQTIKIGSLLANTTEGDFPDPDRIKAIQYAVDQYNSRNTGIALDYAMTNITRGQEAAGLLGAHSGGTGPLFYIGPTTSQGLVNIINNDTTGDLLTSNRVLMVSPSSEAPDPVLTQDDNIFRLAVNVALQGNILVDKMKSDGITSYVIVARNDTWGQGAASAVESRAQGMGMTKLGQHMFDSNRTAAYWDEIKTRVENTAAVPDGETKVGVFFMGYDESYGDMAIAANISDALRGNTNWFVPSATLRDVNVTVPGAVRDFSVAVGLTALEEVVISNAVTDQIDAEIGKDGSFYEYSAYDSVFVLGIAMGMAASVGENASDPATVKKYMADAAMNYTGAALGENLLLDGNGDLRTPDTFTVQRLNQAGEWMPDGTSGSTVTQIGALLALDGKYPDNLAWASLRQAAADYNGVVDRTSLVKLITYNITDPANTEQYVAMDALENAHAGGDGPSIYIGPSLSTNVRAVLQYANDSDIILLSHASEAESLSIPGDNLFRTAISTDRQGHFMAQIMADAGIKSVVTVIVNDDWGRSLNSSVVEALASNGMMLNNTVTFNPSGVDWPMVASDVSAAIGGSGANTGVVFVGTVDDQDALVSAASGDAMLTRVPWFVTPTGQYDLSGKDDTRAFARSVNMTAIVLDVEDNAKRAMLDAKVENLTFYEYSAYDALFVLGNSVESVVESGKTTGIAASDLRDIIPLAAESYEGVLGDIALNTNGDLRSPDRFAVWTVNSSGMWMDTGVTKQTPVVEVGALLAIGSTDYADDKAWDALRQAAVDYNGADERQFYLNPQLYDITNQSDPSKYVALQALQRAHDSGNGPSTYIGPSLSSNIEAVLSYAVANNVTLLSHASESESLSTAGDNLFRMAISTDRHGHFMAQVMADAGVKSVITVIRDDAWGRSSNASIVEALPANGLRLAGSVTIGPGNSDWDSTVDEISAAIAQGGANTGVAFVGVGTTQDALAAAASRNTTFTSVPWFVTPSGYYDTASNQASRDFARAVDMTAIVLDVEENSKKAALDAKVDGLSFYEYAAYDALFVLGGAVAEVDESGISVTAAGLRGAIPSAADAYEGILGDISLNSKGDLRSPDRFAVWKADSTTGAWMNTGVTKSTPVVDIGAIVILESASFDDSPRLAAMRLAINDYNTAAEDGGSLYLNLRTVQSSLAPGAATDTSPSVLDAVTRSHGTDGIKYYVGPSTSGNSKRVLDYANTNGLTMISPSSTAPSLAIEDDALFRLVPNDSQQGKVLADIVHNQQGNLLASLINQDGHEHVIMVVRDDTWGQGLNVSISQRLGVHAVDITRIVHDESDADWSDTAMQIDNQIGTLRGGASAGDPIAVLQIGFPGDFVALAAQADAYPSMRTVPWFGTDGVAGTAELVRNDTARQFADAVNLTATKFDVAGNAKFAGLTAALESQGFAVRTIYEYSAYDSVFVMGRAIESAMSARGASYTEADVRSNIRAAAAGYEGALGDIELNRAGDLRTPNSYAAWTVENGIWNKTSTYPSTPVFDIGALLLLDNNPIYTDDDEKTAMDLAVDDFNTEHELIGDFYIDLAVQSISISPDDTASPAPDALAGITQLYDGGNGPSYYVGPSTSGNTGRVLEFANTNEVVVISHSSTAPSLAVADDYLFRMTVPDSLQGVVLGAVIGEREVTNLVMAIRDDTWGAGVNSSTTSNLDAGSVNITRVVFPESEADWNRVASDLATAIGTAKADAAAVNGKAAVLFIGFPGDFNAVASRSSANMNLGGLDWLGADGIGRSNEVIRNSTSLEFAKSVNLTTIVYTAAPNDINRRINPNAVYGPSAYDSVYLLGNALKATYQAGSMQAPAGPAVRAAIPGVAAAYSGALGNVTLDGNGDLATPVSYGIHTIDAVIDTWTLERIHDGTTSTMPEPVMPTCSVRLERTSIPIGNVVIGQTSNPVVQTVIQNGTAPLSTVEITASEWTSTTTGSRVLHANATLASTSATAEGKLSSDSDSPYVIGTDGTALADRMVISFRLDATGATTSMAGGIEQTVTYTVSCTGQ